MRVWPSNPAYEQAVARSAEGAHEAALALLDDALAAQPDRPRIYSNKALMLLNLERFDEARAAADRGRTIADPDDPYPLQVVAKIMDRTGDSEGAVKLLDVALARAGCTDFDRHGLWMARAWALLHLGGRDREAVADARRAVEIAREPSEAKLLLARALASANRWGEGKQIVDALLAGPLDADAHADAIELRGTIARGMRIVGEMLGGARIEAKKRPKQMDSWLTLGMALTMAGQLHEAAEAFDRAHERNPEPDGWPDEPHMLSVWEADCRLALISEHIAKGTVPSSGRRPKRAPKKTAKRSPAAKTKKSKAPARGAPPARARAVSKRQGAGGARRPKKV